MKLTDIYAVVKPTCIYMSFDSIIVYNKRKNELWMSLL